MTADEIFAEIRMGMKDLSIEDIKEILRIEIRKQIMWAHHVDVGTSQQKKKSGLAYLSNQEISLFEKFEEEKEYNKNLDKKLLSILESLKISINKNSLEYKVLRNNFKEIYELRYDWARSLLKKSGRSDDDFRREIERKLNLELFPELKSVPNLEMEDSRTTQIQELDRQGPSDQEVEFVYTDPLKSSKISKVITRYIEEKDYENIRTKDRVQVELNYLVEEFGDVAIGSIDKAKAFTLKTHLSLLPKNKSKLYPNLSYHEILQKKFKKNQRLSTRTVNETLSYLSQFMKWCEQNGFSERNHFEGLRIKESKGKKIKAKDIVDRFTLDEIEYIFRPSNYLSKTIFNNNYQSKPISYYWIPLIALFTGARLNEICSLYYRDIEKINCASGEQIWSIKILNDRLDKSLKTEAAKRIIPIHENLLELDFLEFLSIQEKRKSKNERIFNELKIYKGSYYDAISKWWNRTFITNLKKSNRNVNFHSIRHSVFDTLKQRRVRLELAEGLLGWESGTQRDRYGKMYEADVLKEHCIDHLIYEISKGDPINFKKLKVDWETILK